MRLIDADELRKSMFSYYPCVDEHAAKHNYCGDTLMDYEVADLIDDCIDNAPTIDAVPVVRCKDCVSYHRPSNWPSEYTKGQCRIMEKRVHPDDFCSYGERKDGEG